MNVLITYSEEFDQLYSLRQFFRAKKVKIDERTTDFGSFPIQDVLKYDLLIIQNQLIQDVSDPAAIKSNPGLEVIRELRANHHSGIPVLLVSEKSLNEFERDLEDSIDTEKSNNHALFMIYSPGLKIFSLEDTEWNMEEILELKSLSSALVTDICEMLLDLKGYLIDKITHKLIFHEVDDTFKSIDDIKTETERNLEWVDSFLNRFFSPSEYMRIEYSIYRDALYIAQLNFDNEEFYNYREILRDKCEIEVESRKGPTAKKPFRKRFKVLLLDDDPQWLGMLEKKLSDTFDLVLTSSGIEAIDILDKDKNNNIDCVITDWRLYTNFSIQSKWQELQGYDVLQYAAKNGSRALIALTSLYDGIVHKIRNDLNLNITLITKDFLNVENNLDLFKNIIDEKCNETAKIRSSLPLGKRWSELPQKPPYTSLEKQYFEIFTSGDWKSFENDITEKANLLWDNYERCLGVSNRHFNEEINTLNDIYTQYGLSESKFELRDILILRRIWLALWFNQKNIYLGNIERGMKYVRNDLAAETVFLLLKRRSFFEFYLKNAKDEKESIMNKIEQGLRALNHLAKSDVDEYKRRVNEYKLQVLNEKELKIENKTEYEVAYEKLNRDSKQVVNKLCILQEKLPLHGILPEEVNWLLDKGIDVMKGNPTANIIINDDEITGNYEDPLSDLAEPTDSEIVKAQKDYISKDYELDELDELDES